MTIITAQGGAYLEGSFTHTYDLQTSICDWFLGFSGIIDVEFIDADSLSLGDEARNQAITNAQYALKTAITHW